MKSILIRAEHEYAVKLDAPWKEEFHRLAAGRARIAIVLPQALRQMVGELTIAEGELHFFEIPEGESAKSISTLELLWAGLGSQGFTRSDLLVAIGGGSVTDIAGFAAATWLRGMDWIAIPTTLVGMVDAGIGGKTGINSIYGKNLIGAFHSPLEVIIDPLWLQTLSDRDFAAGLAEVVKSGFIADGKILEIIEGKKISEIRANLQDLSELISRSVQVKATVVSEDFKESYAREILNYGHTLGHAVELDSGFSLRHGEAVSIGLVYAAELAFGRGELKQEILDLHRSVLAGLGLPISYPGSAWPSLLKHMALDKKARGRSLRFVGIKEVGKPSRMENFSPNELSAAYERISV